MHQKKKALLFKTRCQQNTQDIPCLTPAVVNKVLFIYLLVWDSTSHGWGCLCVCYVTEDDLKHLIFRPPGVWSEPVCLVYSGLGVEPRALSMAAKGCATWTPVPVKLHYCIHLLTYCPHLLSHNGRGWPVGAGTAWLTGPKIPPGSLQRTTADIVNVLLFIPLLYNRHV